MIVKILQKSASFKAVRYNTSKVEKDRGELLLVQNFGILNGIENLRPQDYINYLEALSSRNSRIKYPQFHVAISTKGRAHSKEELSTIAQQWMQGMGYGKQPYLLIFHKDSANNHIHIVSSRVGRDGKKIADSYEKLRAYQVLNQILGENEQYTLTQYMQQALSYSFSTRAQFTLLLELQGYAISIEETCIKISKYGRVIDKIEVEKLDTLIAGRNKDTVRIAQIRALMHRYAGEYDNKLQLVDAKFSSQLSRFLYEKFGLQVIIHGKAGKTPYGYTVIDHAEKSVFKGGEIMPLREFITLSDDLIKGIKESYDKEVAEVFNFKNTALNVSAFSTVLTQDGFFNLSSSANEEASNCLSVVEINISDDVDDEAVHSRRRKGKQKPGSITR
ncbi:relaxase/mobilization nuclease domain-containing protein [Sphingobacterium bovistauri]|uniref:Relaxase/mobilization nuclease domain-containing protein n=1 Tax=Sphingobacterium bovistauri TaxID=2781959 RepID=A0ABS7Z827_9SPHI|nr:relaxase/mobilization nuclease domain-containing protein [Sphingobacterium bovistauri]MCA5006138.1 relaxase/mobilization nuclease domain-containing protein [Sphingobacterium bovistauri]